MFTRPMTISTLDGEATREIDGLVDTGASYSLLPASILGEMGVAPVTEAHFRLATGERVSYPMGGVLATIDGATGIVPVVFGPESASPLIGMVTLEILRLAVDPVNQSLFPVDAYLT